MKLNPGDITTVDKIPNGWAFKPLPAADVLRQTQFIKIDLRHKHNVVNVATWTTGFVDPQTEVVVLGGISLMFETLRKLYEGYALNCPNQNDICLSFNDQPGLIRFLEGRAEASAIIDAQDRTVV